MNPEFMRLRRPLTTLVATMLATALCLTGLAALAPAASAAPLPAACATAPSGAADGAATNGAAADSSTTDALPADCAPATPVASDGASLADAIPGTTEPGTDAAASDTTNDGSTDGTAGAEGSGAAATPDTATPDAAASDTAENSDAVDPATPTPLAARGALGTSGPSGTGYGNGSGDYPPNNSPYPPGVRIDTTPCQATSDGAVGEVTAELSNLKPGTSYLLHLWSGSTLVATIPVAATALTFSTAFTGVAPGTYFLSINSATDEQLGYTSDVTIEDCTPVIPPEITISLSPCLAGPNGAPGTITALISDLEPGASYLVHLWSGTTIVDTITLEAVDGPNSVTFLEQTPGTYRVSLTSAENAPLATTDDIVFEDCIRIVPPPTPQLAISLLPCASAPGGTPGAVTVTITGLELGSDYRATLWTQGAVIRTSDFVATGASHTVTFANLPPANYQTGVDLLAEAAAEPPAAAPAAELRAAPALAMAAFAAPTALAAPAALAAAPAAAAGPGSAMSDPVALVACVTPTSLPRTGPSPLTPPLAAGALLLALSGILLTGASTIMGRSRRRATQ